MCSNLKGFIHIFDLSWEEPENVRNVRKTHEHSITTMKLAQKNNVLLSADKSGVLKVTLLGFNNELRELASGYISPGESIWAMSLGPNDLKLVTVHDDKFVRLVDLTTLEVEKKLEGHGSDVIAVDWHPTKSLIVSSGKDRVVKFWDPSSGKNICSLYNHTNTVNKITFNKNENLIASSGKDTLVWIFDIWTMKEYMTLKGHNAEVTDLEWNPKFEN